MKLPLYFDYAATTPVDPRVAEKMVECLTFDGNFANPASRSHVYGWRAEQAVERARRQRSEEHTSELQSRPHLVCRLLLEKKKQTLKATSYMSVVFYVAKSVNKNSYMDLDATCL